MPLPRHGLIQTEAPITPTPLDGIGEPRFDLFAEHQPPHRWRALRSDDTTPRRWRGDRRHFGSFDESGAGKLGRIIGDEQTLRVLRTTGSRLSTKTVARPLAGCPRFREIKTCIGVAVGSGDEDARIGDEIWSHTD